METMNISLSPGMEKFVQSEVIRGGYGNPSEYILALIREDQRKKEESRLETLLQEGMNSGISSEMTSEDWIELKQRVYDQVEQPIKE